MEYHVPSFVVSDEAWSQGKVNAPAFSTHGQIYLRETIPDSYRNMVTPHEVTHVMRQVEFSPYLDFLERTPTMLNIGDEYTGIILDHIAKQRGQTLDTIDPSILYDEFNAMMYGSISIGNTNIFQSGKGAGMFHNFDAYAKELTELHERFKAENQKNSKFSLKAPVEETRNLVAASAPTEYAESGRWQSAAEQAKSLQDKVASDTIGSDYWPGGKVEYSYGNLYQAVRNGDSASVETIRKALEASGKDPKSVDSAVKSRLRADLKEAFWDSESLNDSQVRELSRLLAQWDPEADPEDYLEKTVKKKWKEAYQGGKGEYSEYRKYYDILKKTFGYSNDEIIRMGKDK